MIHEPIPESPRLTMMAHTYTSARPFPPAAEVSENDVDCKVKFYSLGSYVKLEGE